MRGSISAQKPGVGAAARRDQRASPAPTAASGAPWTRTTQRTPAQQRELASQQRQPDFSLSRGGTLSSLKRAGTAAALSRGNTQTLSRSNTLTFSKAEKFGSDRTPDTHADIQNDAANDAVDPASIQFQDEESAAARFTVDEDDGDLSSDLDPTEVAEAMAHRKRTQVGKLLKGKRRASSSSTALTPYSGDTPGAGSSGGDGGGKAVGAPRQLTSLGARPGCSATSTSRPRVDDGAAHDGAGRPHDRAPRPRALPGGARRRAIEGRRAIGARRRPLDAGQRRRRGHARRGAWRGAIDEEGGDITGRGGDVSDGESSLAASARRRSACRSRRRRRPPPSTRTATARPKWTRSGSPTG